ncbi:MAG: hypothetical protein HOP19_17420 [Acidobacteria bacterium]|nr:hypothetical protein [Acidobacteriota bacterium]
MGTCPTPPTPETKALSFLQREVPAWKTNNGCFSCHNNGDAARALYAALRKGIAVPANTLAETNAWLSAPLRWDENKGDPGFSDKKLANLQFAAALAAAIEAKQINETTALQQAARKLLPNQSTDGSWAIDAAGTVGSPATWGTPLATWMAVGVLRQAKLNDAQAALAKAERWLSQIKANNIMNAATLVWAFSDGTNKAKREEGLQWLRRAQTREGGWGPYADAPPECFDTALALLALQAVRQQSGVVGMIQRGRAYLIAQQNKDGSWPATTRPAGGDSYAQMMSTTGWATLALLETQE